MEIISKINQQPNYLIQNFLIMNWNIKKWNFKWLYCLAFVFGLSNVYAQSPDLYAFIVTQADSDIGAPVDKINMGNLMKNIKENVPGMNVHVKFIDGAVASQNKIKQLIRSSNIDANDVVWYYYSGHGENYDTWPQSGEKEVPLTWVHTQLKSTNARLTIAMYDCCSYSSPESDPPNDLNPKSSFYKLLFLEAKGNVIAASCSSTQYSFGNPASGGIFTNEFIDALREKSNWDDVFATTKRLTTQVARERERVQVPTYAIQVNTPPPAMAPSLKTRKYQSLSAIATEMTISANQNGRNVTIKIKDIKRWNPGVTEDNFKSFKKLKFDPFDSTLR